MTVQSGQLQKMRVSLADPVNYALRLDAEQIPLNRLLGAKLELRFGGQINCIYCNRPIRKSFNQGYCYPCFQRLARCDSCIVRPELCHYFEGTCREPEWADQHCMQDHIVYLANSSGVKVGITRASQLPTRWIDQGAVQALPILRVSNRLQSGLVEVAFARHIADKTNWRAMLKGQVDELDLMVERERLLAACAPEIADLQQRFGLQSIQVLEAPETVSLTYPVLSYPSKVVAHNLDKTPLVEGQLLGIKGQYLMLDTGVINIRKYTAYQVEFSAEDA
ncbi:MAG TPA: DUF2797 domain-containing protein [Spongiibacteraceae bacterium]|jgi:hypothetical protein|nr:DUF2797 domain-containing protein [Spongiibacteraceae bacterium]HUH37887.1 DUF2797 domain-containing protein [Spongiibacteraceae bacterium]